MGRKRIIFTSLVSIILVCVLFIGNTLSIETIKEVDEELNYYSTGNLDINYSVSDSEVVLNNSYPMSYEDAMGMDPYRITVNNNGNVDYEFNLILNDVTETDSIDYKYIKVQVGSYDYVSLDSVDDNIIMNSIIVKAGSSVDIDIFVWVSDDIPNSEIGKGFYGKVSIDGFAVNSDSDSSTNNLIYNLDSSGANRPVIEGDMIPVYYDYDSDVWKRADFDNRNELYKWYDYDDKMWANSVIVSNNSSYYLSDEALGKEVKIEDIVAFYTWIPRYKYKIVNNDDISIIDIKFESGVNNTSDVSCDNDKCYYNDDILVSDSNNNLWYSHKGFYYNDKEVSGFWVGKFETSGSGSNPSIIPDSVSLRNQTVIEQFNSAYLFNYYDIGNLESHLEMSLEYGALIYLTYSKYGICDNNICKDIYNNNSSSYYTGSGSLDSDSVSIYGSYNYQGYRIDNSSDNRVIIKDNRSDVIGSSTLNIYGVYDLRGGSLERVMGVSKGIDGIDSKYYNLYNGELLGDGISNNTMDNDNYIIVRGNLYNDVTNNMFNYINSNGNRNNNYSFRVVIS